MLLNKLKKIVYILIISVLSCMLLYWGIQKLFVKPYIYKNCLDGRLAYKAETYDERGSIELEKVIKESGKESTYEIHISGDGKDFRFEVNKDIYEKYVKNYNTITFKVSKLWIYIAKSKNDFYKGEEREVERYSFPWEESQVTEFRDDEIKESIDTVKKVKLDREKWCNYKFSFMPQHETKVNSDGYESLYQDMLFDTNSYSYGYMYCENPLKEGAIKCN